MNNIQKSQAVAFFEGSQFRKKDHNGKWFFSIIDIVGFLSESKNARRYWSDLKQKLLEEGFENELSEKIVQLKLASSDGKNYSTDCADTETMFRIIQSVPSPKAEPLKRWLAKVGYERVQEIQDPERSLDRARENWKKHGRSEKWIQQRMMGQETRNKLTDYWSEHGVEK